MKALSLTQPWAMLVALGAKRIETRSWGTAYRGPLAIHAAKSYPGWAQGQALEAPFYGALKPWFEQHTERELPRGAIIATATIADCAQIREHHDPTCMALYLEWAAEHEREFGDYSIGRWIWLLTDVQPLPEPVFVRGALGLWEWTPEAVPA